MTQGPLHFRNIHLSVCHRNYCVTKPSKKLGNPGLLGEHSGSQPEGTISGVGNAMGGGQGFINSTSPLDKWTS